MTHLVTVSNLDRDAYQTSKHIRPLLVKNCNILFSHLFGDDMGYYQDPDTGRKEPKTSHSAVLLIPMSNQEAVNAIKTQYVGAMYDADPEFIGTISSMADMDAAIMKIGGTKSAKLKTRTINEVEFLSIDVSNNSVQQAHVDPVLYVSDTTNLALPYGAETDTIANGKIRNGAFVSASLSFAPIGVKCFANIHAVQFVAPSDGTINTGRDTAKAAADIASAFGAPNPDASMANAAATPATGGFGNAPAAGGFGNAPVIAPAAPATPAAPAATGGFGNFDSDIPY